MGVLKGIVTTLNLTIELDKLYIFQINSNITASKVITLD